MKLNLKRIAAAVLAVLILSVTVGCGRGEDPVTESQDAESGSFSVAEQDDTKDPENTEDPQNKDGPKVEISTLKDKEGLQKGIDVSKWQGKIDWQKVKGAGVDFAVIRIGYRAENGQLYRDGNADYNLQQAQKEGLLMGVYFFSTAKNAAEAIEEANFTLSVIKGYSISYPVVYDCEGFKDPNSRMYSLTADQRTENAMAFLETVAKAGYEGMFYGSVSDLADPSAFTTEKIAQKYKIWVAQYKNPPYPQSQYPDYNGRFDMWQYTNKGIVSGVEGNCDMIISYFEKNLVPPKDENAQIIPAKPPKTEEELLYTDVYEDVTAKKEVNLRLGAGSNFDVVTLLKNGTVIKRTGVGKNGWSRLEFNGRTVYAISSYLTTDLNFTPEPEPDIVNGNTFTPKTDSVTAKQEVNLRLSPSTTGQIAGLLKNGEVIKRTAVSDKGWSRLEFNGQTVYAVTSYLTEDLSYKPPADDGINTEFEPVNEQVTAKSETNLRTLPSVTDSEILYTLKNGEYLTRTGVSSNGWSRLDYNGQTVYAVSSYLTK